MTLWRWVLLCVATLVCLFLAAFGVTGLFKIGFFLLGLAGYLQILRKTRFTR